MDWDQLYGSLMDFASVAAEKINQTADLAALQVKLSVAEKNLESKFAALGKISYEHFTGDDDLSAQVAEAVDAVNHAKLSVLRIRADIKAAKAAAEARAAEEAAAKAAAQKAEPETTERRSEPVHRFTETLGTRPRTSPTTPKRTAPTPLSRSVERTAPISSVSTTDDSVEILVEEEAE